MKCSILTFSFAHNFGAVLQAYALKNYIESFGLEASIVNYAPQKMKDEYSINVFKKPLSIKILISRLVKYREKKKQYDVFERFIETNFAVSYVCSKEATKEALIEQDYLVCGSDQIWNDDLTYKDNMYYFPFYKNV